ncbi:alpha/beta fold hydrolase [Paenalkalicoccus suaedae]|uniref:Alpha/beta fold hydrolase n=1 Tax=Paenalkalicoccus suaedae TaxID=2592382 RepID=A0A859FI02_9BACI|nr:alpha/beta fold hydrolase [Paenalkalicoccus suaedae]QKS72304.1 alpha/beta fold hydrolase [Paenalkalicoccus suaedae]
MPLTDLPIEALYEYAGRNPRPEDFDAYWEAALKELSEVDAQIEIREAAFQTPFADCFDLYFTGVKGARVHAKYVRPKNVQPGTAIVEFHGYGTNSGDWQTKLGFAAAGFSVFSLDVRGQGGLSEDVGGVIGNTQQGHITRGLAGEPKDLFYRSVFLDCAQLAGIALDQEHVTDVYATGWSQGGALALVCAALEPRVSRVATVYPFLSDYKRVWEMDLAVDAYEDIRRYFRRFDPTHKHVDETFRRLGYIDIQHLAPRVKADVLMGTGLADAICPPSTQFAAYNKLTGPKCVEIYPDFGHEDLSGFRDTIFQFFLQKNG